MTDDELHRFSLLRILTLSVWQEADRYPRAHMVLRRRHYHQVLCVQHGRAIAATLEVAGPSVGHEAARAKDETQHASHLFGLVRLSTRSVGYECCSGCLESLRSDSSDAARPSDCRVPRVSPAKAHSFCRRAGNQQYRASEVVCPPAPVVSRLLWHTASDMLVYPVQYNPTSSDN